MGKTFHDYDEQFDSFLKPMSKRKEYKPEIQEFKREIRKKCATEKEIRSHKRNWQECSLTL